MVLQLFILNDDTTGEINEIGRVDQARDQDWITNNSDTTTTLGHITTRLAEDESLEVNYYSNQVFPDPSLKKVDIVTKEIIDK